MQSGRGQHILNTCPGVLLKYQTSPSHPSSASTHLPILVAYVSTPKGHPLQRLLPHSAASHRREQCHKGSFVPRNH